MRQALCRFLVVGCLLLVASCSGSSPVKVTAQELSRTYKTNENEATERYKDKRLVVAGRVAMGSPDDDMFVMVPGEGPKIVFRVPPPNRDPFKGKVLGKKVRIEGTCKGRAGQTYITIEDCKLVGVDD